MAFLKVKDNQLDVLALEEADSRKIDAIQRNNNIEVYQLPSKSGVVDGFVYSIHYDPEHKEFWVEQSGGFAGGAKLYGPAKFSIIEAHRPAAV